MLDDTRGVVLYTDGAAKPNPGPIGWGTHGYLYEIKDDQKPVNIENHVITNRGYIKAGNLKTAVEKGAILVEPIKYFDFLGSSSEHSSNNRAEVKALCHSLEQVIQYQPKTIHVLTDSEYLRNGLMEWCKIWQTRNWRTPEGGEIKNREWWESLYNRVLELQALGASINVEWVRGHSDIFGNTQADILAGIGAVYSMYRNTKREFKVTPAKGYWKQEVDKHPFLNFKRAYFNSVPKFNTPGTYFLADSGAGDLVIGKRIPESGFAIIKLREHIPVIEAVKDKQFRVANSTNAIIEMKLDRIFSKDIYPYLSEHGEHCLLPNRNNLNLNFMDRTPITVEKNPTGLSMRAIDTFNLLEELMMRFLEYREIGYDCADNNIALHAHDITNTFFDTVEKQVKKEIVTKYILKPEFGVGFRDMKVTVQEPHNGQLVSIEIPLILGIDLLPRNNLKKLEDEHPKVSLITWRESINSLRYATIVECDSGIGIWSNFFADRLFLKN